jgi:hypothetical protein
MKSGSIVSIIWAVDGKKWLVTSSSRFSNGVRRPNTDCIRGYVNSTLPASAVGIHIPIIQPRSQSLYRLNYTSTSQHILHKYNYNYSSDIIVPKYIAVTMFLSFNKKIL